MMGTPNQYLPNDIIFGRMVSVDGWLDGSSVTCPHHIFKPSLIHVHRAHAWHYCVRGGGTINSDIPNSQSSATMWKIPSHAMHVSRSVFFFLVGCCYAYLCIVRISGIMFVYGARVLCPTDTKPFNTALNFHHSGRTRLRPSTKILSNLLQQINTTDRNMCERFVSTWLACDLLDFLVQRITYLYLYPRNTCGMWLFHQFSTRAGYFRKIAK